MSDPGVVPGEHIEVVMATRPIIVRSQVPPLAPIAWPSGGEPPSGGSTDMGVTSIQNVPYAGSSGITRSGDGTLAGTPFDDSLTATRWLTTVEGGAGSDVLRAAVDGGVFNLLFDGGSGDDVIEGSYAGDTYLFARGDGRDAIRDDVRALGPDVAAFFAAHPQTASYQDVLRFGAGIASSDVGVARAGENLVLHLGTDGTDAITVIDWYDGTMFNKIERFEFADGSVWFASDVDHLAGEASVGLTLAGGGSFAGSQYDDALTASAFGTVLQGGGGNDTLRANVDGGIFDLVLAGGQGDDLLEGSYAGDTYRFARGDGKDTIHDDVRTMGLDVAAFFAAHPETASYQDRLVFGEGIAAADVQLERSGEDLVLHVGAEDAVTVDGWYDGTMFDKIETIAFADGTIWQAVDVDQMLGEASSGLVAAGSGTLTGSQYDDSLQATGYGTVLAGGNGNDVLKAGIDGAIFDVSFAGGRGDDVLVGSYGRDFYAFALGDGHDRITDDVRALGQGVADFFAANPDAETYQDHLQFGTGIDAGSVTRTRDGEDLVLSASEDDSVTIQGWFDGTAFHKIELIGFADGTTWTAATAEQGLA